MKYNNSKHLDTIKDKDKFLVALDMGLGKTSLLLSLIDYKMFVERSVKKVLIITPFKVSLSTWQKEIDKWKNFNYMENALQLINGDEKKRNEKLINSGDYMIHIISSSLVEWLHGKKKKVGKKNVFFKNELTPEYDMIIVDECSQFKSTTTKRYKALEKLSENKKLFLLSGTPFSSIKKIDGKDYYEKADEMYYIFKLLGIYNKPITHFRRDFCFKLYEKDFNYKMNTEVYQTMIETLSEYSISEKLEMNIKLNKIIVNTKNNLKMLNELKKEYLIELENQIEITAKNKAIMINKALQIGNGFLYDKQGNTYPINDYKLTALKKLLKIIGDKQVVIFYNFKEDKKRIMDALGDSVKEYSVEIENEWNKGKIKYLILSPFSDKYGLNLQYGGYIAIWYSLIWSAESVEQAERRIYRTGQKNDVTIYYLIADGGFDKYVFDTLVLKIQTKDETMRMIKLLNEV